MKLIFVLVILCLAYSCTPEHYKVVKRKKIFELPSSIKKPSNIEKEKTKIETKSEFFRYQIYSGDLY